MHLVSVNQGAERAIKNGQKSGTTGIFKLPQEGPVEITPLGIPRDAVIDVENHGGPDQAVYVYGLPDYAWWAAQLGKPLEPGTFGENLTLSEFESAACSIGDYLQVGAVRLQVTAPRIPCSTLAARMEDPAFVKRFRAAERPGVYCRVLQPGFVQAGDPVIWEPYSGPTLSAIEMFREFYEPHPSIATLRRKLAAPICVRGRDELEEQLRKLLAQAADAGEQP